MEIAGEEHFAELLELCREEILVNSLLSEYCQGRRPGRRNEVHQRSGERDYRQ